MFLVWGKDRVIQMVELTSPTLSKEIAAGVVTLSDRSVSFGELLELIRRYTKIVNYPANDLQTITSRI